MNLRQEAICLRTLRNIHPALERKTRAGRQCRLPLLFLFQRIDHGIGPAGYGYFIRVMTGSSPWVVQRIEYDEVEILPFQFFVRMRRLVMGFEGKAYEFLSLTLIWPSVWAMSRRFQTEGQGHRFRV